MNLDSQEPLEALPMPDSAVELEVSSGIQTFRQMVIAALKQVAEGPSPCPPSRTGKCT